MNSRDKFSHSLTYPCSQNCLKNFSVSMLYGDRNDAK